MDFELVLNKLDAFANHLNDDIMCSLILTTTVLFTEKE